MATSVKEALGDWYDVLGPEFEEEYMKNIGRLIVRHYDDLYPKGGITSIFRAFNLCQLKDTKVVIIGQDPYHDGSAHGLAFSSLAKVPPSLRVIFKALESEYGIKRSDPNLTDWAKQGVLLLNASLTVFKGQAGSCKTWGWDRLIAKALKSINGAIAMCWGADAKSVITNADNNTIMMIETCHPAATLYNPTKVFKPGFEVVNSQLEVPIKWV